MNDPRPTRLSSPRRRRSGQRCTRGWSSPVEPLALAHAIRSWDQEVPVSALVRIG
jgi:hypothetical protein